MSEESIESGAPYRSAPRTAIAERQPVAVRTRRRIPKLVLPIYAARRCLRDGANAAHAGQIDDAMASLRGYVALRAARMASARPSQADAEAAMLAATCAALRGDAIELAAVGELISAGDTDAIRAARTWLALLGRALAGELEAAATALAGELSPIVAPLRPAVLVLAAERSAVRADAKAEAALLALFDGELADEARARVLVALARVAIARGDRIAALAYLREIPAQASPLHRFAAALAEGRGELERQWAALPEADRSAAAGLAAAYAGCATSAIARLVYEICDICATSDPAPRGALLAALMGRLVHEGRAAEALALADQTVELAGAGAVRVVRCHALVALGRARDALPLVANGEPPISLAERDLALLVAAAAGEGERLGRLLAREPETPPPGVVRSAILIYAATAPSLAYELPAWRELAPDDPDGTYAWALLELRQNRAASALAAFQRALAAKPELATSASAVEPVDVARLHVARDALRAGDLRAAQELIGQVTSPRCARDATLLRAMVLVRGAAAREQTRLDAATLGPVVRGLLAGLDTGSAEHRAISLLAREADELRARWLLLRDRTDEARAVVHRLGDAGIAPFLAAVLAVLEDGPLVEIERALAGAEGTMAGVLLAEVRGARGNAAERIELLESMRARSTLEPLVDEALAQAYHSARRGLDAKRLALEELRSSGALGVVLASELREALAFEAPPAAAGPAPSASASSPWADALPQRARLLADHVARHNGAAADAALAEFRRAMLDGDLRAAAAAERAALAACARQP